MFARKKINYGEYKRLLKEKREHIKNNPEYYGEGTPSNKNDYKRYKNFLKKVLKFKIK